MKLDIPYYSQYLNVTDPYWQLRSCGVVCLKMVMDFYGGNTPPADEIIKLGLDKDGYGPSGWIHEKLLSIVRDFGLKAEREEFKSEDVEEADKKIQNGVEKFVALLKNGQPVIVSIIKKFEIKDKFHMVVLTGFEQDEKGEIKGFYYNDPDYDKEEDGKNRFVSIEKFKENWRRLAIFLSKE